MILLEGGKSGCNHVEDSHLVELVTITCYSIQSRSAPEFTPFPVVL